jgi:hypothetical protein
MRVDVAELIPGLPVEIYMITHIGVLITDSNRSLPFGKQPGLRRKRKRTDEDADQKDGRNPTGPFA